MAGPYRLVVPASRWSRVRPVGRGRPGGAAVAAVLLLSGALAGCGGADGAADDPAASSGGDASTSSSASGSPSPEASESGSKADPATDGQLTGDGYALTLPEGWQDATAEFQEYSPLIDAGALDGDQSGRSFSDNVNVLRNAGQPELPTAQAERQFAEELGTVASEVRVEEPADIAGVDAVHLTGRTRAGDVVAHTDQYICWLDDTYYVLTFSYGDQTPAAEREEEVAAMLGSWTWG